MYILVRQRELYEAALNSEEKDLKRQEVKLKAEVAKWMNTTRMCCSGNGAQSFHYMPQITLIERSNGEAMNAQMETRLACSEITHESVLGSMCKVVAKLGQVLYVFPHPVLPKATGWTSQLFVTTSTAVLEI